MILFCSAWTNEIPTLIGDRDDGSRAVPVHRIPLLDEDGIDITPADDLPVPFSTRQTCAKKCHSYEIITGGWHFNQLTDLADGRAGHPWILIDRQTGTQVPLSYRQWRGTFHPSAFGISQWEFIRRFGRHLIGGSIGEELQSDDPTEILRTMVSGKLEVNCLACHDADPAHDQAEFALQIARENYRWANAASSAFVLVNGSAKDMPDTYDYLMPEPPEDTQKIPPAVLYDTSAFDGKNHVFFNITTRIPSERCYYCHSTLPLVTDGHEPWTLDEDVHLGAGMLCVDCHRNGLEHTMLRGYEGESELSDNPLADVMTCTGCHLGTQSDKPDAGRMKAPVPLHRGIPPIHFDKLACTACHSGIYPEAKTQRVKTSLAHALGTHHVDKSSEAPPHIISPVFARNEDGKIAPHHLLWVSYWGTCQEQQIVPLPLDTVQQAFNSITSASESQIDNGWKVCDEAELATVLRELSAQNPAEGNPVYITQGKVIMLDEQGLLTAFEHDAAKPYLWQIAHDVRPAAQSLGVRGCGDCHDRNSPFFFATVEMDSPLPTDRNSSVQMHSFLDLDSGFERLFAATFLLRPWYKYLIIICTSVILLIVWLFVMKYLLTVLNTVKGMK
ncbi:MAG: hypothetical protein ACOX5R_04255 [bacterium]